VSYIQHEIEEGREGGREEWVMSQNTAMYKEKKTRDKGRKHGKSQQKIDIARVLRRKSTHTYVKGTKKRGRGR